jgi:hypothetical protein
MIEYYLKKLNRMAITDTSTVDDIYDELGWPAASEDDLAAWNYIDCYDGYCEDPDADAYFTRSAGLFSWQYWSEFSDYCATATTECADNIDYADYDGWAVGVYV